jgi:AcrR family transcriptional regulator
MESEKTNSGRMGRPRTFREDEALNAAMRVFWEKGYEGTSLDDLTGAMKINRSSLYSTFGDKEALFRRVMRQYSAGPLSFMSDALNLKTARAVVEALLRMSVKFLGDAGHPPGCLSIQGGLACGSRNEEVKQAMVDSRKAGLAQLQKRLQRARAEGDLRKSVDPRDLARLIIIVMNGLGVQAVNGATTAEMNRAVDLALQSLPL